MSAAASLQVFSFEQSAEVRTVLIDGAPWFIAGDVATALGFKDAYYLTRGLDEDEKGPHIVGTLGGEQIVTIINEAGLYSAILRSRVPQAKAFKRWITHEVLPSIRKTGQYGSGLPTSFAEALELAAAEARKVEALEARALIDAPKVEAWDELMDADGFYAMGEAARLLGMGRTTLFRTLRDLGIIQQVGTLPYRKYDHHFKITTHTYEDSAGVTHAATTTRLTPSGLQWLRSRLAGRESAMTLEVQSPT